MLFVNRNNIEVKARTVTEIKNEIEQKNTELATLNQNIKNLDTQINKSNNSLQDQKSELQKLELELKSIILQQEIIKQNLDLLESNKNQTEQDKTKLEENLRIKIRTLYKQIKSLSSMADGKSELEDGILLSVSSSKISKYVKSITNTDTDKKNQLQTKILELLTEINLTSIDKNKLETSINVLEQKKSEINTKIAQINKLINQNNTAKAENLNKIKGVNVAIANLTNEQKEAELIELQNLTNAKAVNQSELVLNDGEYYFEGRGRDVYDGHPVGLSQVGAYGAANAGKNYVQILQSYYTAVDVGGDYSGTIINVSGVGNMNIEDYLAGLGEVPSYACETESNKGKDYAKKDSQSTIWDCWPEESIKAQIVAARSYAVAYIKANPGVAVATNTSFQVYQGGTAKKWAVEATRGQVINKGGNVMRAYYANSFRGHSENNELFWTAKATSTKSAEDLKGYAESYLRGIDDSAWTYKDQYYNYIWKTNSISFDKLSEIFKQNGIDVGKISSIVLQKGSSLRNWAVTINAERTTYLAGWKFKSMINDYIYNKYPESQRAYIFSTEFVMKKVGT